MNSRKNTVEEAAPVKETENENLKAEVPGEATENNGISQLKKDNEELKDQLLRLAAEYNNFRKRSLKEKEEIYKLATADIIENLLPGIDSLELARDSIKKHARKEDIIDGIELVYRQFMEILDKMDVEEIPSIGETFNPELHNAVLHVEDENYGENVVIEQLKKGYTYKEKVIRHSMVKVAN
jgi:molecular chaperone GrpE